MASSSSRFCLHSTALPPAQANSLPRGSCGVVSGRGLKASTQLQALPSALKSFQTKYGRETLKDHRMLAVRSAATTGTDVDAGAVAPGKFIPASPILLPAGPWKQIPGGVTAAKGF